MHRLLQEIMEQPQALQRLIEEEYGNIQGVAEHIRSQKIHHVLIAARGSSDNVAIYAKYLLGMMNGLPVALAAPSMYTVYDAPPRLRDTLVVAISQSGMSPDIVAVVQDARRQGMLTLALTNAPDSRLAHAAEHVIQLRAGEERSVAATKTYTTELAAVALLSVALGEDTARLEQVRAIPEAIKKTLTVSDVVKQGAQRYRYMSHCVVIGRGYNYATAFEVSLKLKELTYSDANPYSSADFMHGPIAIVDSGFPVWLVAPAGQVTADALKLAQALRDREAEMIVTSDKKALLRFAQTPLPLYAPVAEWLSPITAVVPGQLFAYHLAVARGLDPEKPRGLRKVTETR